MGIYSDFLIQDINVLNKEALIKIPDTELSTIINKTGDIDFSIWTINGFLKIEGYWDEDVELIKFLNNIAKFIEGEVIFTCDKGYLFKIIFKDKKVFYQKASIVWNGEIKKL